MAEVDDGIYETASDGSAVSLDANTDHDSYVQCVVCAHNRLCCSSPSRVKASGDTNGLAPTTQTSSDKLVNSGSLTSAALATASPEVVVDRQRHNWRAPHGA